MALPLLGILSTALSFADPLSRIVKQITDTRVQLVNAQNEQQRIEMSERLKALEVRRDVLAASATSRVDSVIRALMAVPVIAFLWKVIIWDKILALGSTDDLSANLWYVTMMVLGFYYLHWTVGAYKR